METRKGNLAAVILSGGSSLFTGLPERLEKELRKISPPQARSDVRYVSIIMVEVPFYYACTFATIPHYTL